MARDEPRHDRGRDDEDDRGRDTQRPDDRLNGSTTGTIGGGGPAGRGTTGGAIGDSDASVAEPPRTRRPESDPEEEEE